MKKMLIALSSLALLLSVVPVGAADADAGVGQYAGVVSQTKSRLRRNTTEVIAFRSANTYGVETVMVVVTQRCTRRTARSRWRCRWGWRFEELSPSAFSVDPALRSARLESEDAVVDWIGRDEEPDADHDRYLSTSWIETYVDVTKEADATGSALGRTIGAQTQLFAFVGESVGAFAYADTYGFVPER